MLKKEVKKKLREASTKFLKKQINLTSSKSNAWLRHAKRLDA